MSIGNRVKLVKPEVVNSSEIPPGGQLRITFDDGCGFWLSSNGDMVITTTGNVIKAMCSHGLEVAFLVQE